MEEAFRVTPAVTKVDSLLRATSFDFSRKLSGSFQEGSRIDIERLGVNFEVFRMLSDTNTLFGKYLKFWSIESGFRQ